MLRGFKDFVLRGNVIDLAVAVVVGAAFATVVDQVVSSLVTPLINAAGGASVGRLGFFVRPGVASTFIDLGAIINAVIVFLLTAAVVYVALVVPMNTFTELRRRGAVEEPVEAVSEELATLREIRDLLAANRPTGTG